MQFTIFPSFITGSFIFSSIGLHREIPLALPLLSPVDIKWLCQIAGENKTSMCQTPPEPFILQSDVRGLWPVSRVNDFPYRKLFG